MIKALLREEIEGSVRALGLDVSALKIGFSLDVPTVEGFGDLSSNVALILAKTSGKNPKELAEAIVGELRKGQNANVEKIEVAGAGFINFFFSSEYFRDALAGVLKNERFGENNSLAGQKVVIEYTDPNPFKEFHIGHLMTNTIGEAVSRLASFSGAEVKRACYQGDVGMHVAKAIFGMLAKEADLPAESEDLSVKAKFLGQCYAYGAKTESGEDKKAIAELNKKIYERSDEGVNRFYDLGRQWSLDYFETIYKRLGTKFDFYFFESATGPFGREIVEKGLSLGVFEKSDGAVIFPGEKYGLHTRVFINSEGLPTYEAKELGLSKIKYDKFPYDKSVVVTGNDINEYFKVLLCAMEKVFPELAKKTTHLGHGILRLPSGKMASRTGDVITGGWLIDEVRKLVENKIAGSGREGTLSDEAIDQIAVGAIKYSILKQGIGQNIIFDFDKSISFEGNSGPYLQYAHARCQSILEKAGGKTGELVLEADLPLFARKLVRFTDVVERATATYSPHLIVNYLTDLAGDFNSYYAATQILDGGSEEGHKLALVKALSRVLKNGLNLLGIEAPTKI